MERMLVRFMVRGCMALALVMAALQGAHAQTGNTELQRLIPYNGHLDRNGAPAPGPVTLTFRLYAAVSGGTALWTETHTGVPLVAGNFSLVLGSVTAIPGAVFQQPQLHVEVDVDGVAVAVGGRQRIHAAPYALRSNASVPLGTILDWYAFSATTPVPDGFLVCNGQVVNDPASPFNGLLLPNLTDGRFTMGVARAQLGALGGRNDLPADGTHSHGGQTGTFTNWIPGTTNLDRATGSHHGLAPSARHRCGWKPLPRR